MFKALAQVFDPRSDAISLLKQDHRKVEALFEEYEAALNHGAQWRIAQKICAELEVHAKIEESIFYPAAKKSAPKSKDCVDEGIVEHMGIKRLVKEIKGMAANEELFDAKVKVLIEYVKHHVREEENEMFPKIADGDVDLQALEQRLLAAKQKLMKEGNATRKPAARKRGTKAAAAKPATRRATSKRGRSAASSAQA